LLFEIKYAFFKKTDLFVELAEQKTFIENDYNKTKDLQPRNQQINNFYKKNVNTFY
jgi:hypothetical protein